MTKKKKELKNSKVFVSDGASVMAGVINGVAARLQKNQGLTHMLNIHCICHCLALACADSSSQITVLKDFEDVLAMGIFQELAKETQYLYYNRS